MTRKEMFGSAVKARNNVARRSLTVLGAGVATTAMLLSSGTAAFAKSDITMKANHKTVKVGKSVRFSGWFGDDGGVHGEKICLWQYARNKPVKQLAPCVSLHERNGKPVGHDSFEGYFSVTVKATKPGRMVVVPVVRTSYDPKIVDTYAEITIVVTR